MAKTKLKIPTVGECEDAIGIVCADWPGNCFMVAQAIVRAKLLDGAQARYGHYLGPVSKKSRFDYRRPFQRHGWIAIPGKDLLVDPTRWVFEVKPAYLAVIASLSPKASQYDIAGSNAMQQCPPPARGDCSKKMQQEMQVAWPAAAHAFLDDCFGRHDALLLGQVYWLAHLRPTTLGKLAKPLYDAILAANLGGLIPLDFQQVVYSNVY